MGIRRCQRLQQKCLEVLVELSKVLRVPRTLGHSVERFFAEFFAGIGLMRLGLEKLGWKVAFANDIDSEKHQMYRASYLFRL
jgi:hypothetical protein